MNSIQVMEAIEKIANTPGKNDKLALLTVYMADPDFENVMVATYNPFITYGIRPKRSQLESVNGEFNAKTWELLSNLATRKLTGDAAARAVSAELLRLDSKSTELLWRIINKDLKAGFSESSLNKVKKGLIPEFPYQRCSLPKEANIEEWPWQTGIISQIKADGMFFDGNVETGIVNMTSRQGQPLPPEPFEAVAAQLQFIFGVIGKATEFKEGMQAHGELLVLNEHGETLHRKVGNGLLNKVIGGKPLPDGHKIIAMLWDVIPLKSAVKKGSTDIAYLHRLKFLSSAIGYLKASRAEMLVELIETKIVRSYEEAMEHYMDARRRKLEGTVIKKPTMIWKDGTSKDQVKLKQEVPVELEVYGFEEGKEGAKTALTFGSLKCKTKCDQLRVDVGTGFSDELRAEINASREDWIGAVITVKSNEIMYAARGKLTHSLFLPVYEERRFDKSEADTFEQVVKQFDEAVK